MPLDYDALNFASSSDVGDDANVTVTIPAGQTSVSINLTPVNVKFVERNPLRAGLVSRVDDWQWSSLLLARRRQRPAWYSEGPVKRGRNWLAHVAQPQTDMELLALRRCINRGCPYGSDRWTARTTGALHLESTLRPRGRPRKALK